MALRPRWRAIKGCRGSPDPRIGLKLSPRGQSREIPTDKVYRGCSNLEQIAYLERMQQPGIMLFLDFEKAFDRLDRPWIERCMAATGFGPGLQRWVRLLHSGTTASVAMNGWQTRSFPVSSGVFQGSPLSPLLYALACQPLAAHVRRRAREGAFQQIRLPSTPQNTSVRPRL